MQCCKYRVRVHGPSVTFEGVYRFYLLGEVFRHFIYGSEYYACDLIFTNLILSYPAQTDVYKFAISWLSHVVAGFSLRRPRFDNKILTVGVLLDEVTVGLV
jgi:hypothetical protein